MSTLLGLSIAPSMQLLWAICLMQMLPLRTPEQSEWNRIKDMLPPEHPKEGKRGRPAKCDNRSALNGILWIARGGAPWRELPERYGPWQTVYSRFRKWKDMGIFEAIFKTLSIDADFENISIDSTSCKVHQSANGGEKNRG